MEDKYYFYARADKSQQPIIKTGAPTRYQAALLFSKIKQLPLKEFLKIYAVSR